MASSSNPPDYLPRIQDYEYLYASNTNVSNFVSVKLSGYVNYHRWKTQMLCLMEAHEMCWLVDDGTPKDLSVKIRKKYDSLLKGWIFGSVSDEVLGIVVDLASAGDVWRKLNFCFDSTTSSKQDSAATKVETKTQTKDNMPSGETTTNDEGASSTKSAAKGEEATHIETKDFASKLITRNPEYAILNDNVLMAMARTFPSGLDYGETLIYPSLDNSSEMVVNTTKRLFNLSADISNEVKEMWPILCCEDGFRDAGILALLLILIVPITMGYWIYHLIPILLLTIYFPLFMLYLLWWKAAVIVVPPVKNIEKKKKECKEAKNVLELVLETITKKCPGSSRDLYTGPILEAACQDAYEVVYQILGRWPEAIRCKDKNGYDIIQLATIHRSERIYNLIYIIGERKSIYRTIEDSSKNNLLHLAGRLAPSNKLKRRTGAALQLQRELQWRQEVEKLVFPTFVTKENIFMETPEMVFTKEHETLVKEGEKWIKAVAESCSITAALITTIVFAAAITVPGGSNQDTGIPVFTKKAAFTLFAIADAISLFSSTTSLLVFLSILTARFAEQDFLVRLPRRLIIGLCTLLISTTAMMVAFSATLFLVFSQQKLWVLAPICAFALLPIAFFFVLLFPPILDQLQSTSIFKFGKSDNERSKLVQNNIQFMFSK